ncbi:hypothetical protein DERF_014877 [Dermatophagoides farinae]|uniref:Uncharacterized protein n=1 Tax=Dermatophagoides farinae TaxID=6954 RepID=A0A922HJW0_DERFA|nr:hypothetical protein DERF_014877 [Dermatophagoides farinae]
MPEIERLRVLIVLCTIFGMIDQQHKQCLTAEYSVMIHWMLTNYMDNCGNSRANTCRKASSSWWSAFIRPRPKVATPYGGDSE